MNVCIAMLLRDACCILFSFGSMYAVGYINHKSLPTDGSNNDDVIGGKYMVFETSTGLFMCGSGCVPLFSP